MILESSLADLVANVQNLGHFWIRDHFYLSAIDSCYSMNESQNMRHIMGLYVNSTRGLVAVKD